MVISISRREDIPRFRFEWFREQLDAGFVDVVNPFNSNQVRRVSLLPADADPRILVFWTRDPRPVLDYVEELEKRGYRFYVMTTLTSYPGLLEPAMPPREAVINAMAELAGKLGKQRVIWRYDPVFLSSITNREFHLRNFKGLVQELKGSVQRVIISVYDEYRRAARRIAALENFSLHPHVNDEGALLPEVCSLLAEMADIARGNGLRIYACAEGDDLSGLGIEKGACIDRALIRELWNIDIAGRDRNQRPHCGCAPGVDIGRYGPCPGGCVYCYART
jgi:hypothetical protein